MPFPRNTFIIWGSRKVKSKGLEKDVPEKFLSKESSLVVILSDKIDFKIRISRTAVSVVVGEEGSHCKRRKVYEQRHKGRVCLTNFNSPHSNMGKTEILLNSKVCYFSLMYISSM